MALTATRHVHAQSPRSLTIVLGSCLLLLISSGASAHPFILDQHNDAVGPFQGFVIPGFGAVGQGFTPTMPRVDAVELQMNSQIDGAGGMAYVRIRLGGIAGPILAVSGTEVVPATTSLTLMHFDFLPVPLTPGLLHVIEVVATSGTMGVFVTGLNNDSYPGGTAYFQGAEFPEADLWFREGPFDVATGAVATSWGRVKALYR